MESALEKLLNVRVKQLNRCISGGCINSGSVYQTEDERLLFVKKNAKLGSDKMFIGELEGLKAIRSTETVSAPRPIVTSCSNNRNNFIVMEYLDMTSLSTDCSIKLGNQLAEMHMFNLQEQKVDQFGFHVETCCGFIPQNNTWTDNWITFFIENRLSYQIQQLSQSSVPNTYKKKVIEYYWPQLKSKIPKFFEGVEVKPSLLHGDLWSGNAAQSNLKPVIFDPATFYGHHEYDIASTTLFGGYSKDFYNTYFEKIPKANGFENRMTLYHLFHYLNHWNHFGGGYVTSTINTFDKLLDMY